VPRNVSPARGHLMVTRYQQVCRPTRAQTNPAQPPPPSKLRTPRYFMHQVLVTPHTAFLTNEALDNIAATTIDNLTQASGPSCCPYLLTDGICQLWRLPQPAACMLMLTLCCCRGDRPWHRCVPTWRPGGSHQGGPRSGKRGC
jgi:hypothetical protein